MSITIHSSITVPEGDGIQLWINLPKHLKSIEPDYQQLQSDMIPESRESGITINGEAVGIGEAAFIEDVEVLDLHSGNGARLMWCFGLPHHEEINQHGPYVD